MVVTPGGLAVKLQTPGSVRQNPGELVACDLCAAPSQVLQIRAQISVATTHTSSPSPSGSSTSTTSTDGGALRTAFTRCPPLIDPHSSSCLKRTCVYVLCSRKLRRILCSRKLRRLCVAFDDKQKGTRPTLPSAPTSRSARLSNHVPR